MWFRNKSLFKKECSHFCDNFSVGPTVNNLRIAACDKMCSTTSLWPMRSLVRACRQKPSDTLNVTSSSAGGTVRRKRDWVNIFFFCFFSPLQNCNTYMLGIYLYKKLNMTFYVCLYNANSTCDVIVTSQGQYHVSQYLDILLYVFI